MFVSECVRRGNAGGIGVRFDIANLTDSFLARKSYNRARYAMAQAADFADSVRIEANWFYVKLAHDVHLV